MAISSHDSSHGKVFSSKVRALLGSPIVSSSPNDVSSFWLLAAFSRSRLRLDDLSVGSILSSILGGDPSLFQVVEVEGGISSFLWPPKMLVSWFISCILMNVICLESFSTSGMRKGSSLLSVLRWWIVVLFILGKKSLLESAKSLHLPQKSQRFSKEFCRI